MVGALAGPLVCLSEVFKKFTTSGFRKKCTTDGLFKAGLPLSRHF